MDWIFTPIEWAYKFNTDSIQQIKDDILWKTAITNDTANSSVTGGNRDKSDICQRILTTYRHRLVEMVPGRF